MVGTTLSHYRIEEELGRGGMGVVYKAEDTKLDRTVAIKVLPSAALASEEDRTRFYREAKAAAQLHHPHIASVFEIDEAVPEGSNTDDIRPFIVMEYIDGETLADVIKKSPLKLTEAVNIASQVAEALKVAHAKEIVHRDIKSANVMLTTDGVAKVLDFGLAKTNQSTMLTRMGSTLGTVAYMSPEQARGQEVDGRSDLYSLGTMLYEMISRGLPFGGDYEQAIVYGILNESPEPLTAVRTGVPMGLEWIVNKLLHKDAEYRYQTAADLLADLKSVDLGGSGHSTRSAASMSAAQISVDPVEAKRQTIPNWMWAVVAIALIAGVGLGTIMFGSDADIIPPSQFIVDLEERTDFPDMSWSADNRSIFYTAQDSAGQNHYVRRYSLDTGLSEIVPGTEGAEIVQTSPDGRWLIIRDANEDRLERLAISGGQATPIPGTEGSVLTIAVGENGDVYFSTPDFAIAAVSEDGSFRVVADADLLDGGRVGFAFPAIVPNSNSVYWSSWTSFTTSVESWAEIGGKSAAVFQQYIIQKILDNGLALVTPSGLAGESTSLISLAPETGQTSGAPVPIAYMNTQARSSSGHLVFEEPAVSSAASPGESIYALNEDGSILRLGNVPGISNDFAISNDGKFIIIETRQEADTRRDLYRFDLESQTVTRLTRSRHNQNPYWSRDDEFVYFDQHDDGVPVIARRRSDASSPLEVILTDSLELTNPAISPDGGVLIYGRMQENNPDLYLLDLESGEERLLATGQGYQTDADFSPDGDYIVYRSGAASEGSIVVMSIDGTTEVEITSSGGYPVWSERGDYIFYMRTLQSLYHVPVTTESGFQLSGVEELIYETTTAHMHFDLTPDGRVLLSIPNFAANTSTQIRVILNFDEYAEGLMRGE